MLRFSKKKAAIDVEKLLRSAVANWDILSNADNDLIWSGDRCEPQKLPVIDTYDDHRMAMAFAPACVFYPGLIINNPLVVTKSYPLFWDHLRQAGYNIEETP